MYLYTMNIQYFSYLYNSVLVHSQSCHYELHYQVFLKTLPLKDSISPPHTHPHLYDYIVTLKCNIMTCSPSIGFTIQKIQNLVTLPQLNLLYLSKQSLCKEKYPVTVSERRTNCEDVTLTTVKLSYSRMESFQGRICYDGG